MPDALARSVAELAVVERSGFDESRHYGTLVGLAGDGDVLVSLGDPDAPMLPRSSAKPWQAVGCLDSGWRSAEEHTALAAGSHTGEDRHVHAVHRILAEAGLDASYLQCPPDWPEDAPTRDRRIRTGELPSRVRMNCSGKHAAMLASCVLNGWDLQTYLSPQHPLQQRVREAVVRNTGVVLAQVAVDGCGAPLFASTVRGLARAVQRLVTAVTATPERTVADAMRAHPFSVGGTDHPNSRFMARLPGALCKGGAEGVLVAAGPGGEAVAMKVVDGSPRATTGLALAVLRALGADVSGAGDLGEVVVLGGGRPVGRIRLGGDLQRALTSVQ